MRIQRLTLSPEELDGDLPLICVRTGNVAEGLSPVWFTRSQTWAWVPLGLLVGWAVARLDWGVLASWWA
ncbi:MAG TPA: hypothetical protein VMM13_17575, partial [Euzebya sp.]|nr:hypothetical protein [Euzebya sp.]